MRIEAFTEAKDPLRPDANEDSFVVLPGRAYAVIDGVTDRVGARYDGVLAGRYAAQLIARAVERMLGGTDAPPSDAETIIPALSEVIVQAYRRHGVLNEAQRDWGARICSTLAVALTGAERVQVLLVGDSSVRVNRTTVLRPAKDLDLITATLRRHAWRLIAERLADPVQRERLSRQVTWHGVTQDAAALAPVLDAADLAAIGRDAEAECAQRLPHVPRADVVYLLEHGIVRGQGRYQNDASSVLGYSCLDGFEVPPALVRRATFDAAEVHSLELFSDGYFRVGEAFGVRSWEDAFQAVEREDAAKLGRYPSPKGSVPGQYADDRTYLGVLLDVR